ncbi:hypothetical protein BDB01DRAFT_850996 [Pilobolus umbonatus]|nr:hypothetical protein BDB01DRAFT_850996 [Pilobolus umbonatus]
MSKSKQLNDGPHVDSKEKGENEKKSYHYRKNKRNRRASAVPLSKEPEEADKDSVFIVPSNINRRRSETGRKSEVEDSPDNSTAFQSLQDIITEMKSLTADKSTKGNLDSDNRHNEMATEYDNDISTDISQMESRNRRHSEPYHKSVIYSHPTSIHPGVCSDESRKREDDSHCSPEDSTHLFSAGSHSVIRFEDNNTPHNPFIRNRSKSVPNSLVEMNHHLAAMRRPLFSAYTPFPEALESVESHKLYRGLLKVNAQDSSDANVECEELNANIYIYGSRNRNRAIHGNEVAVELVDVDEMLSEKQTKKHSRIIRRLSTPSAAPMQNGGLTSIPENNITEADEDERPKYCGRVVCILEKHKNKLFPGTLSLYRPYSQSLDNGSRDKKKPPPKIIWFIPSDKRIPLVAVPIKHGPAGFVKHPEKYKEKMFLGKIERWPVTSLHPFGKVEKEIEGPEELRKYPGDIHIENSIFAHLGEDDTTIKKEVSEHVH